MTPTGSIVVAWLAALVCAAATAAPPAAGEPAPSLRPSTRLAAPPADDDPRRQKADALRRAITTDVDQAAEAVKQRETHERELDALRGQSKALPALESQLKAQTEKARRERNGLLVMAAVLLAVMAAIAALVFRRGRSGGPAQDPAAAVPSGPDGSPTH